MRTTTIHIPVDRKKEFVALAKLFLHRDRSKGQLSAAIIASFFYVWGNEEQRKQAERNIAEIKAILSNKKGDIQ